jgi:hypothetical protein
LGLQKDKKVNLYVYNFAPHLFFYYICLMNWIKTYTYDKINNSALPADYWTQTTTWEQDSNTETTAKNR